MLQTPGLNHRPCARCGGPTALHPFTGEWLCNVCGQTFLADAPTPGNRHPMLRKQHPGEVHYLAESALETAQYAVMRGKKQEAVDSLKRALDYQEDYVDAHLWLARFSTEPNEKRDHLSSILAVFPNNLEATRDMMVLNGQLTPEAAGRTHHENDAQVKYAGDQVSVITERLACPVCSGDITTDESDGHVECRYCGYRAESAAACGVGGSLMMELLRRKAEPVRWQIGGRLLHCKNCGAERTVPAQVLSMRCPFCDTNHVVVQDALHSFSQPDSLVRFSIDAADAAEQVRVQLRTITERLMGLFDRNGVKDMRSEAVFLPFWMFDALANVSVQFAAKQELQRYGAMPVALQPMSMDLQDGLYDIPVCAIKNPPAHLTAQLGEFDLSHAVAYQPKLLARHPASLYDIDVDAASLEARGYAAKELREKHRLLHNTDPRQRVSIYTTVTQMQFKLVLMPVWVVSILEMDGDTRLALVNGQTGNVVFGKAQKPKR
jgi:hypothetical protein